MDLFASLTVNDLINAAFWAAVIVIVIRLLGWGFRTMVARTRHINFDPTRADEVRKRCSRLFPIENLQFDGATFKRGTIIRIVTHQQASIEGEFLGTNYNNILCLVANGYVIAQELQAIETIQVIAQAAEPV